MTRQQARHAERERIKRAEALIAKGLAPHPADADLIDAAAAFAHTLAPASGPARARQAAHLAHRLNESSLRRAPTQLTLACKAGCAYCCYSSLVAATAPEIFLLAAAISERVAHDKDYTIAEVLARCEETSGRDIADRIAAKKPCPLLIDDRCSHYEARPTACRQATSTSLAACIDEYEGRDLDVDVEGCARHILHAGHVQLVLMAGLRANSLSLTRYELSAALACALTTPDAERRWLRGEDVFSGVAVVVLESSFAHAVDRLAARLG